MYAKSQEKLRDGCVEPPAPSKSNEGGSQGMLGS